MLKNLTDRFVLQPTTHSIPADGKLRRTIPFANGHLEAWTARTRTDKDADLFILKFPGTGGRAERASAHPAECWPELNCEIWAVNPPGYGGSSGRASLQVKAEAAGAAFRSVAELADGRPIVVTGNSLGTLAALYVSASFPVSGLLLRNPPPLRQLIVGQHGWWNLRIGAKLIARQVPAELCSITNAAASIAPAVFVSSANDRVVPSRYQQLVTAAYSGEKRILVIPGADHATPIDDDATKLQYIKLLDWLRSHLFEKRDTKSNAAS